MPGNQNQEKTAKLMYPLIPIKDKIQQMMKPVSYEKESNN